MDTALKQRILGIIVLFALIGICIMVLLQNNKTAQQQSLECARKSIIATQQKQTPAQIQTTVPKTNPPTPATAPISAASLTASVFAAPVTPTTTPSTPSKSNNTGAIVSPTTTTTTPAAAPAKIITKPNKPLKTTAVNTAHTTAVNTNSSSSSAAYIVQVGQFSKKENALSLAKAINNHGFTATTQSIKTSHGEMTRVIIGEKGLTHSDAEKTKQKLAKLLKLNSIITPVPVTKNTQKTVKIAKTTKITKTKTTAPKTENTATSDDTDTVIP